MKKSHKILVSTLLLFLSFNCISQIKNSETEVKNILCRKWLVEKVLIDNKIATIPEEMLRSGIVFNEDYSTVKIPENLKNGSWKYNDKDFIIEVYEGDKLIGTIKSIEKNQIIFSPVIEDKVIQFSVPPAIYLKPSK